MSMLDGLSRVWKRGGGRSEPSALRLADGPEPVAVGLIEARPGSDLARHEIVGELHKNYQEVLGLIRKVDLALDEHERRAGALMELADRTCRAVEALPEIHRHTGEMAEASREFTDAVAQHQRIVNDSIDRQTDSVEQHTIALSSFGRSVQESVGGMTDATGGLAEVIAQVRETDLRRERRLTELVARSQKHQTALLVGGLAMAAATALVVILVGVLA